jgi:hypothetical protein
MPISSCIPLPLAGCVLNYTRAPLQELNFYGAATGAERVLVACFRFEWVPHRTSRCHVPALRCVLFLYVIYFFLLFRLCAHKCNIYLEYSPVPVKRLNLCSSSLSLLTDSCTWARVFPYKLLYIPVSCLQWYVHQPECRPPRCLSQLSAATACVRCALNLTRPLKFTM